MSTCGGCTVTNVSNHSKNFFAPTAVQERLSKASAAFPEGASRLPRVTLTTASHACLFPRHLCLGQFFGVCCDAVAANPDYLLTYGS
eukprot:2581968-Amphidinium_carterae.1